MVKTFTVLSILLKYHILSFRTALQIFLCACLANSQVLKLNYPLHTLYELLFEYKDEMDGCV